MIKKIHLSLIVTTATLLFGALPAFALDGVEWGIFEDYTIRPNKYAFDKILNKEPINYYIFVEDDKKPVEKNEDDYVDEYVKDLKNIYNALEENLKTEKIYGNFSKFIENAFDIWFDDTKDMIIKDGRKKEFNDIMPILNKNTRLRRVRDLEKADIVFAFVYDIKAYCPPSAGGCIAWKKHIDRQPYAFVRVPNPQKNKEKISESSVFHILTHEIGHYFGLTDQYYQETPRKGYTIYNNPRIGYKNSTMGASHKIGLDCDDVDGFINLIDLSLSGGNINNFSARAQKGWSSFCNGKNKYFIDVNYKNATPFKATAADWVKTPFNSYGLIVNYDNKGRILTSRAGQNEYLFDYTETDRDNLISVSVGDKKLSVRYGYDFDIILCWQGQGARDWGGTYFSIDNDELCEIYYASKVFTIKNSKCSVRNAKDDFSKTDIKRDFEDFSETEEQKENLMLEQHICPLFKAECKFFKRIYDSRNLNK